MRQVFRVEHKDTRLGPFQTPGEFTQALARRASEIGLRHPGEDGLPLGNIPWSYVFGCPDLATLRLWMFHGTDDQESKHIVRCLRARGFVLAEYLVEDDRFIMGDSQTQLAFDADDSRDEALVDYRDLAELLTHAHQELAVN